MSRIQLLSCLLGISLALFNNGKSSKHCMIIKNKNCLHSKYITNSISVESRSARRLEGEGIQGGSNAKEGQFPYQISLEVEGQSICGGSILSEGFAVTAAHCVIDQDGYFMNLPLKVVAGISNLKSRSSSRVAVDVVKVYVLKEYDPTVAEKQERSTGDIAILKVRFK